MEIDSVGLTTSSHVRLRDFSASVAAGDLILLLGANGAGKSSLLDVMSSMVKPTTGRVHCPGMRIGYAPQSPETGLFGQSCLGEVAFSLSLNEHRVRDDWPTIQQTLLAHGLPDVAADDNPMTWSTGLQRRFITALTLMQQPDMLLLDEPSAGLDAESQRNLFQQFQLHRGQTTIVMATHDLDAFAALANRVWVLDQGRLTFDGSPRTLYQQPDILRQAHVSKTPSMALHDVCFSAGMLAQLDDATPDALAKELYTTIATGIRGSDASQDGVIQQPGYEAVRVAPDATGECLADTTTFAIPVVSRGKRGVDPRAILCSTSLVTIATATAHSVTGVFAAVLATIALLLWIWPTWFIVLRWTFAWVLFAALTTGVSGLHMDVHGSWFGVHFDWLLAEQALVAVVPYWCYLQLGQLFTSKMTALELQAMIDWLLRLLRIRASNRHIVSTSAGMVFRFIPAIAIMYETQVRAVRIRTLTSSNPAAITRRKRQSGANIRFLSRILAPLMIRLIGFGEMTTEALTARQVWHQPPQYWPFRKTMNRQSWLGIALGIIGASWIVLIPHL